MDTAAQETMAEETPKRGRGRPSRRQTVENKREIMKIATKDKTITHQDIADQVGVCRQTVSQTLAKYGIKQEELEDYRENQADILLGLQHRISKSIDDECIQKGTLRDRVVALGIVYDKHRLQTNQSTQNVASLHSIAERAIKAVSAIEKDAPQPIDNAT